MTALADILLPELEFELATTRRILAAVPDGQNDYRPHDKSMKLSRLAGHTAEMPMFAVLTLTHPPVDLAVPGAVESHQFETSAQNFAAFDKMAEQAVTTLRATSDDTFDEPWSLVYGDYKIFSGNRYGAYRSFAMNHLIHHRAQLGGYLRLLNIPLPKTYGPSADEQ